MKIFKILIIISAIFGVIIIGFGLSQPNIAEVKKVIMIDAPIGTVFNQIKLVNNWEKWFPWKDSTNEVKFTFSRGDQVGNHFVEWESKVLGKGKAVIERTEVNAYIQTEFFMADEEEPYMTPYFETAYLGDKVKLTWACDFKSEWYNAFGKLFDQFVLKPGMEHAFEIALENIKEIAEKSKKESYTLEIFEELVNDRHYIFKKDSCEFNDVAFQQKYFADMEEVYTYLDNNAMPPTHSPSVMSHKRDRKNNKYVFSFGCEIHPDYMPNIHAYETYSLAKGKVLKGIVTGLYSKIHNAYDELYSYMERHNLEQDGDPIEFFTSNNPFEDEYNASITIIIPLK